MVALELRETDVTRAADVVFPVAAGVDKAGMFVNWEGRPRLFEQVFTNPNALPDSRVLAGIAEELGRPLGFRTVGEVRAQMAGARAVGRRPGRRRGAVRTAPARPPAATAQLAVLAYLEAAARQRLDAGRRRQPPGHGPAARSPGSAGHVLDGPGATVTVTGDRGSVTLPAGVADLPDGVVWVPANSAGNGVLADLGLARQPGHRERSRVSERTR